MLDLVALISICEKAASVGAKALASLRKKRLSPEEEQLLVAAAADGEFFLLTGEQIHGALVRAGGKQYADETDPASCARYLEAFKRLCERGYVVHDQGQLFILTAAGHARADQIR